MIAIPSCLWAIAADRSLCESDSTLGSRSYFDTADYAHYVEEFNVARPPLRLTASFPMPTPGSGWRPTCRSSIVRTPTCERSTTSAGGRFASTSSKTPHGIVLTEFLDAGQPRRAVQHDFLCVRASSCRRALAARSAAARRIHAVLVSFRPERRPGHALSQVQQLGRGGALRSISGDQRPRLRRSTCSMTWSPTTNAGKPSAQRPDGLFWQYDVADGMEESISGSRTAKNIRPTINSYMAANARAIAQIAGLAGRRDDGRPISRQSG